MLLTDRTTERSHNSTSLGGVISQLAQLHTACKHVLLCRRRFYYTS